MNIAQAINESSNEHLDMLPRLMKMQQQSYALFILMYLQNDMVGTFFKVLYIKAYTNWDPFHLRSFSFPPFRREIDTKIKCGSHNY
jgi:hypothetical protein